MKLTSFLTPLALCIGLHAQSALPLDGVSGTTSVSAGGAGPTGTGDFFTYANGCPGGGGGLGIAYGLNEYATTTQAGGNTNQFAYKALNQGAALVLVFGFELWTTSVSTSPVPLVTELYDEATPGGAPNVAPIRTGTMVVGTKPAFYRTTFAQPHLLQSGAAVFLSFVGSSGILHTRTGPGGTLGVHYYHAPTATAWNGPFTTQPWAWRVLTSVATGARPLISNSGLPTVANFFKVNLTEARPGTLVTLGLGASNATWSGLTLPFDLAVVGMPGCKAHASVDLSFSSGTDANGNSFMPIVIPNNPALSGAVLFSQWWVLDPGANGTGVVNSDAAEIRIG
jgi:hypothetical protein